MRSPCFRVRQKSWSDQRIRMRAPAGVSYPDVCSIGRVIIDKDYRGKKWGYPLIDFCVKLCYKKYGAKKISIGAQEYLIDFYKNCGFVPDGDIYIEDNIPHVKMNLIKQWRISLKSHIESLKV